MQLKLNIQSFIFRFLILFVFYSLLTVQNVYANQQELWQKGVQALEQKDYQKAMQAFITIENNNEGGAGLYQNMALAATSLGDDAKAILYLEKALKYSPNDAKIKENLQQILHRNSQLDYVDTQNAFSKSLLSIIGWLSFDVWMILSILLFLGIGFFIYSVYPFQHISKSTKYIIGILIFGALSCYFAASNRFQTIYHNDGIIITEDHTNLHAGPDEESPKVTDLPKGSKVVYKDHIADWWLVTTVYGDEGWIPAKNGERI